ncbi:TetR/AcrR family transcriptional regulator [Rhodococcus sp. C26F]
MAQLGRRARKIDLDDIVRVGRALGMQQLSLNAVASRLGVSAAALYRHVDGRWGLERLVGESILGDLVLHHDPHHTVERHLLSFGLQLRAFVLDHPGLGTYMQTLFPRGDAGRRLMADEIAALCRAGYNPDVAVSVASVVAGSTINTTVAEETQRLRVEGLDEQRRDINEQLDTDDRLAEAHRELPAVDAGEFSKLVLATTIRGLVAVAPLGRPLEEVVADLAATGLGK